MAESSEEDGPASPPAALQNLPRPKVDRPRRLGLSLVWLVPIVALLVAGSLFVRTVILVGPRIDIEFATADGIEPGKTDVRYKEVVVGKVQTVSLRGDRKRVIVTVRLDRSAAGLAVKDTQSGSSGRASVRAASAASAVRCRVLHRTVLAFGEVPGKLRRPEGPPLGCAANRLGLVLRAEDSVRSRSDSRAVPRTAWPRCRHKLDPAPTRSRYASSSGPYTRS